MSPENTPTSPEHGPLWSRFMYTLAGYNNPPEISDPNTTLPTETMLHFLDIIRDALISRGVEIPKKRGFQHTITGALPDAIISIMKLMHMHPTSESTISIEPIDQARSYYHYILHCLMTSHKTAEAAEYWENFLTLESYGDAYILSLFLDFLKEHYDKMVKDMKQKISVMHEALDKHQPFNKKTIDTLLAKKNYIEKFAQYIDVNPGDILRDIDLLVNKNNFVCATLGLIRDRVTQKIDQLLIEIGEIIGGMEDLKGGAVKVQLILYEKYLHTFMLFYIKSNQYRIQEVQEIITNFSRIVKSLKSSHTSGN